MPVVFMYYIHSRTPLDSCELAVIGETPSLHILNDIQSFSMASTLTKLIIRSEHIRLLHAGPTLVNSSLRRRFHIVGQRRAIRALTRACVTCRRTTARPQPQMTRQLPLVRVTPGIVFGVDYAGPVYLSWDEFASQPSSRPMSALFLPCLSRPLTSSLFLISPLLHLLHA